MLKIEKTLHIRTILRVRRSTSSAIWLISLSVTKSKFPKRHMFDKRYCRGISIKTKINDFIPFLFLLLL